MGKQRNKLLVPEARTEMDRLKAEVMSQELGRGPLTPDQVKYEVAQLEGIPLKQGDNGELKTAEAGRIGGKIGGQMVRELVKRAEQLLASQQDQQ